MSSSGRRALWWAMTIALLVAVVAAFTVGAYQLRDALSNPPQDSAQSRQEVGDVAKSSVAALLSYTPDNVQTVLTDAVELTTGKFHDDYRALIRDTVIPGAKEQRISASATVPAVGVESLNETAAVLLVFVNQTVTTGDAEPSFTASSVRVTLDKVDGAWLIAGFDPL